MTCPKTFRDYVHSFCFNLLCVGIIYRLKLVWYKITNPILNVAKKNTRVFRTKLKYFDALEVRFFNPWCFQTVENVGYNNDLVYHPLLGKVESAAAVLVNKEVSLVYICCGSAEEKFYAFNAYGSFRVSKLDFIGHFSDNRSSVKIVRWITIDISTRKGNKNIEVHTFRRWNILQVAHHPGPFARCKRIMLQKEIIWSSTSPDERCLGVCTFWKGGCVVMMNMVIASTNGDRLVCLKKLNRRWKQITKSEYLNNAKNIQTTFWKTRAIFACEEFYSFSDIIPSTPEDDVVPHSTIITIEDRTPQWQTEAHVITDDIQRTENNTNNQELLEVEDNAVFKEHKQDNSTNTEAHPSDNLSIPQTPRENTR